MFYDELKKQIETKGHVVVKNEYGKYQMFSISVAGEWRRSGWYSTSELSKNFTGYFNGYNKEYLIKNAESDNWQIVEAFQIPLKRFEVGDMVLVSKDAKEICERLGMWEPEMKDFVGKILEIKSAIDSDYAVWNEGKTDYWMFPHEALSYPIDSKVEDTQTVTLENGKQYRVKILEEIK